MKRRNGDAVLSQRVPGLPTFCPQMIKGLTAVTSDQPLTCYFVSSPDRI